MREFLKPWRRKIGVVTLVLACVLMAGWVRSKHRCDFVEVNGTSWRFGVESILEHLRFIQTNPFENSRAFDFNSSDFKHMVHVTTSAEGIYELRPVVGERAWRFDWCGFHVSHGASPPKLTYHSVVVVPYWSLVIPLTLLSAYLLLSKLRARASKTTELAPTTGESHA